MSTTPVPARDVPWWKEPTKDQWYAYMAAWLGWTPICPFFLSNGKSRPRRLSHKEQVVA
jgi:hypothetical protein